MFVKKTIIFRSTIWLAFLTCSLSSQSDFSFKNISVKDGLAESTVKVIYEDHEGFIYFGTENGLDIYNGYEFKNYIMNSFDDASILGNKISCIYEDSNNMIWVGTELGVSRFDPVSRTFSRPVKLDEDSKAVLADPETMVEDVKGNIWIKLLESGLLFRHNLKEQTTDCLNCNTGSALEGEKVNVLYKDQNNIVWLGTDSGLFYFNIESGTITEFDLPNGSNTTSVTDIEQGGASDLWVGTTVGLFRIKNGINGTIDVFKKEKDPFSIVSNFVKDLDWNGEKNELWIATNDGMSRYVPAENKFYNIQTTPFADSIIENDISEILIAVQSGRLWFTTENYSGLNCLSVVLDPYEGDLDTVFTHFEHDPVDQNSIADNNITDFIEDRAGHIWIGTGQNGVSFNSFVKPKFISIRYDQENEWGLKSDKIYSITTQSDGMMWASTGFGIEMLSSDGIREYEYEKSALGVNYVLDLEILNDEYLWVASDQGVLRINTMTDEIIRFSDEDSLPNSRRLSDKLVHDILPVNDGTLWLGTGSGVVIIDTTTLSTTNFSSDLIARVLTQDSEGNIWLGTEKNGVYKISSSILNDVKKGKDFELEGHVFDPKHPSGLSSSQITCIAQDRGGSIWVGTNGGLNKYQNETDNFIHYFVEDGLPSNYITGIAVDKNNGLWISSKKGISYYSQADSTFTNYSLEDGIGNIDFHRHSYTQSSDGNIYFGGPMGITKVNPEDLQYNDYQPPCIITRIKKTSFDDEVLEIFAATKKSVAQTDSNIPMLSIDHRVKSFTIDFVALNYHKTVKNQYRYKLVPFDRDWVESSGLRFASYNNLGRKSYTFVVQGSNDDGLWSTPAKLTVKFIPHPLLSYWAFSIYAVFAVVGIYVFMRYRMHKQKYELEEERRIKELDQAREFQMSLIPQTPPDHPDYDIALHMKTSTEVGGDYYDFFPQEDGSMYVVCGDATGHGLNAGMMVSITKAGLYGSNFDTPASTTTRLNQTIKAIDLGTTRMSLNMTKFNNGSFDFTSAGMPPAYLYRDKTGEVDEILVPGLPLGSMKKADFDLHSFPLESNDALVLISDGLPECVNHEGEMLDYDAVKECIESNGNKSAEGIIDSLIGLGDEWMSGLMNDDDITLVVIKRK